MNQQIGLGLTFFILALAIAISSFSADPDSMSNLKMLLFEHVLSD